MTCPSPVLENLELMVAIASLELARAPIEHYRQTDVRRARKDIASRLLLEDSEASEALPV